MSVSRLLGACCVGVCLVLFWGSAYSQFLAPKSFGEASAFRKVITEDEFFRLAPDSRQEEIPGLEGEAVPVVTSHKSPFLAAALSIVLPGLGEYYVGDQIWRGLIFTAIDAGLWYGNIIYNKRGDDSLAAFHAWADSLWLPSKYSDSLNSLLAGIHRDYRITDPNNFNEINMAEDTLAQSTLVTLPLSHRLPERGSQQYYELISKYIQFTYGWKDARDSDPTHSFDYQRHAEMRANMNYQYDNAQNFLYGLIINRVLSAIDAVLLTKDHNSSIRLHGELQTRHTSDGRLGFVPTANINVRF